MFSLLSANLLKKTYNKLNYTRYINHFVREIFLTLRLFLLILHSIKWPLTAFLPLICSFASVRTSGKTSGISASATMPKDLPQRAERNRKIDALRLRSDRQTSRLYEFAAAHTVRESSFFNLSLSERPFSTRSARTTEAVCRGDWSPQAAVQTPCRVKSLLYVGCAAKKRHGGIRRRIKEDRCRDFSLSPLTPKAGRLDPLIPHRPGGAITDSAPKVRCDPHPSNPKVKHNRSLVV